MPQFDLLTAYRDKDRIVCGNPIHYPPKVWIERFKTQVFPAEKPIFDITVSNIEGQTWLNRVMNLKTAAVVRWSIEAKVRSVAVAMSGIDDKNDLFAAEQAERVATHFLPFGEFSRLRWTIPRPALVMAHADTATFANREINTANVGMAMALFEQHDAKMRMPPLSRRLIFGPYFTYHVYRPDGTTQMSSPIHLATITDHSHLAPIFQSFETSLSGETEEQQEHVADFRDEGGPRIVAQWRSFGKTAGVVTVSSKPDAPDEVENILLVLTGLDHPADQAAITAYEQYIGKTGMSAAWSRTFRQIATTSRPLLARFIVKPEEAELRMEWVSLCFAAAFFRCKGVL